MMKLADAGFLLAETPRSGAQVSMLTTWHLPKNAPATYLRDMVDRWRQSRHFEEPFNLRLKPGLLPDWERLAAHQIDLDYHLRHSALPAPGGERELGILASRLHSNPLDRTRPLWEMHVIEGLERNRFAVFLKLHHSQVDGMGAIAMIERFLSPDPKNTNTPIWWEVPPRPSRPPESATKKSRFALPRLDKLARALGDIYLNRSDDNVRPFTSPKTTLNVRLQQSRRVATQLIEISRLERIAKHEGVSMNDVALCMAAGALRRYLIERGELPEKSLSAGVPVSIRDNESVGNAITFLLAKLNTGIADHYDRLHAIHRSTSLSKERLRGLPDKTSRELLGAALLGPYLGQVGLNLAGRLTPVHNLIISNVPGPKKPMYMNGAQMEAFYPISAVMDGQALNITFLSYAGHYAVGFTSCRYGVPSMQRIAVYTGEVLEEMEQRLKVHAA